MNEHYLKPYTTICKTDKVWFDKLIMRPKKHHFMKDSDLKQMWLDSIGVDNVAMVFDDRNQVVDMWRKNGLTCFQVADGDF